jgi:hypothetical protein
MGNDDHIFSFVHWVGAKMNGQKIRLTWAKARNEKQFK